MSYSTLVLGWVMLAGAAHAQAGGSSKAGMMQVRPLPDDAMKLQAKIAAKIVPTARLKIQGAAIKVRTQPAENSTEMLAHARTAAWESFPSAKIGDVDTLTFLVMMQAATDAQNELTAMMEATDKEKQARAVPFRR